MRELTDAPVGVVVGKELSVFDCTILTGTQSDVNLALQDCCIGRGLAAIRHRTNSSSYTYYTMMNLKSTFDHFEADGTVFGSIGKIDFETIRILAPPTKIVESFQSLVGSLDTKIENNALQILALSRIRDSLLPKLMSGKIRVPVEVK